LERLSAADLDPAELLGGLRDMLANALGPGIRVVVEVPTGLPALRADQRQLETVLINLAINARDAIPPSGGEVTFGAMPEVVAEGGAPHPAGLTPGRYMRLWVADTGTGMDAVTLARATEPFFTTKPQDRGTGLGLSMAHGFAKQSGGALWLDSELGRGTTVTFWLPQAGAQADVASTLVAGGLTPRALVVDAAPLMRHYFRHCLRQAGWDAIEAGDTAEAIALLNAGEPFDLLLAGDLMPPGPDAIILAREARMRRPELQAVLVAGPEASPDFVSLAAGEGLHSLRKPVSPVEFGELLASLQPWRVATPRSEAAD
jgi:CheY-like chemotaxis protein